MADRKKTNRKNDNRSHGRAGDQKPALKTEVPQPSRPRDFLKTLGPGLITGASDDDPSGIGTYSQAGAQLGYGIGWTMLLTFPLMAAIQEISARVGRVTGRGIAYVLLFRVTSVAAHIFLDYKRYVAVLKWLTLCLFAYVGALAFAHVHWS